MQVFRRGSYRQIIFLPETDSTLEESLACVPSENRRKSCQAQLFVLLEQLANEQEIFNKEKFRSERDGIFAVKTTCGIRGYGWFQRMNSGEGAFVVSHFIMKKAQKLHKRDLQRAQEARDNFGESYEKP